jgi:putative ABC transport system permease protein
MIARIASVYDVAYTGQIPNANAYRSPLVNPIDTNALTVDAASLNLPSALGVTVGGGRFLNAATAGQPVCVLGAAAAQLLGIDRVLPGERVWVAGMWFYVAGILHRAVLAPEVDSSVLIGFAAAARYLAYTSVYHRHRAAGTPSEIYVRVRAGHVQIVHGLLAATARPEDPSEVAISQPSDALVAEADARGTFDGLLLGLGAIALLVGAIGVANIMVIGVLERRCEIGLRRALGATAGQIRCQFLAEAILLALLGGSIGIAAGALATSVYAHVRHWSTVIPTLAWAGSAGAAILIGAVAGLLPAIRAARLSPSEALRTA